MQAEVKEKEMEKNVVYGKHVYSIFVGEHGLAAEDGYFPLPGYGNSVHTTYEIDLSYSRGWAKIEVTECRYNWNGTGCYTQAIGYVRKNEAKRFIDNIRKRLKDAEDGTPDIKEVFDAIVSWVEDKVYTG